jgi:spore coat polysaccharide biosynthesis protein SpsF (cytidylyltransferase family)
MINKLDKHVMLSRLARLRGSALRRLALGRAIVILVLAMTHSVAASNALNTTTIDQKPFDRYNTMNLKLYLHNQINDWNEFECANELAFRESSWRVDAVNKTTGAYGLFQHMSDYAKEWDAFKQIDKHVEYIDTRYSGSWCKALQHLRDKGWH